VDSYVCYHCMAFLDAASLFTLFFRKQPTRLQRGFSFLFLSIGHGLRICNQAGPRCKHVHQDALMKANLGWP
jgi:hypothetical protein